MKKKPIYVEIEIDSEMDRLWEATQTPSMHEQWDLRFSSITYLPKKENEPQLFSYKTKVGPGIQVEGWGKSVGSHDGKGGTRTSALHFGTDQMFSPIKEGKGYWQYKPNKDSITFLTQYDYDINLGWLGEVFDILLFRPLIGWGTALSFDVLKRWLEKGETPASQYIRFFCQWLFTFLFFFVWLYHGIIPKLISRHPVEIEMIENIMPLSQAYAEMAVLVIGLAEVIFAVMWLFYKKKRNLFLTQIILFPLLAISAIIANPESLSEPFNPLSFNASLLVISIAGYLLGKDVPSAASCRRKR